MITQLPLSCPHQTPCWRRDEKLSPAASWLCWPSFTVVSGQVSTCAKGNSTREQKKLKTHLKKIELHEFWTPQANRDSSLETRPKWDLSKQLGPRRRLVHPPCNQSTEVMVQSSLHRAAHGDPTPDLIVASRAMIEPSAAPRQLVTKPLFLV